MKNRRQPAIEVAQDDGGFRASGGIDFGTRIIEYAGGENTFADLTEPTARPVSGRPTASNR